MSARTESPATAPHQLTAPPNYDGSVTLWAPPERASPVRIALNRLPESRAAAWVKSEAMLIIVLLVQSALSLRLRNTLFSDEALYLYAGHREIALLLHGTPTFDNYSTYFSGAPYLYPVVGAVADNIAGPAGARALSLLLMLGTTSLLFSLTRRMFDQHVAVFAAIVFSVAEPTQFMGHLATYDAPALFLLAAAAWLVVRFAGRSVAVALFPAPLLVLAAATKYAALLFIPTVVAMVVLGAVARRGWVRALLMGALLTAATTALAGGLLVVSPELWTGIQSTTSARAAGTDPSSVVLRDSVHYIGGALLLAVVGTFIHWRLRQSSAGWHLPRPARLLLGLVLTGTALLAPMDQLHLHTLTSLHKHVGYGLLFASPMIGVALSRLLGRFTYDPRRLTLALTLCVMLTWGGINQASARFHDWPNSSALVATLRTQVRPVTGRYLVEEPEVPRYYLRGLVQPYQWTGTYYFSYTNHQGQHLVGAAAYKAAIADRFFDVVALRYGPTAPLDVQIDGGLRASHGGYRLIAKLPADSSYGSGTWWIWRANVSS